LSGAAGAAGAPEAGAMRELVFVKLGGSLITDKSQPYTARLQIIERICDEIRQARAGRELSLLVGHGGGSFPHVSAARYRVDRGAVDASSWRGFVKVHEDAARLNAIVCECFARRGLPAAAVQPSAACIGRAGRIEQWCARPIELLLRADLVPVVYGDICLDEERGFSVVSTEEVFRHLAGILHPQRIILLGKVDGVFDRQGRLISLITPDNLPELRDSLQASDGVADVTGGMLHKVERSLEMGAVTSIVNGQRPGLLLQALLGEQVPGTVVKG
jgi:isopentenyl phosphate kinase